MTLPFSIPFRFILWGPLVKYSRSGPKTQKQRGEGGPCKIYIANFKLFEQRNCNYNSVIAAAIDGNAITTSAQRLPLFLSLHTARIKR